MFERYENESEKDYLLRLVGYKLDDKNNELDWQDIVTLTQNDCHYDSLRKAMQPPEYGAYDMYKYGLEKGLRENSSNETMDALDEKIKRSKIEAQKFRDLRSGYNEKEIRGVARKEAILEEVQYYIKDLKSLEPPQYAGVKKGNAKAIFGVADAHFGKEVYIEGFNGEPLNVYNEDIFYQRMESLFNEYVDIIKEENISEIKFFDLSDSIEGILRVSGLQHIKYGIVESAIKYANYMTTWLNALSEYVYIDYYGCLGNHCEIRLFNGKSSDFAKENMQIVIDEIYKIALSGNDRIKINPTKSIQYADADGYKIMATHGQNERDLVQSVKDYKELFDIKVDLMISGHMHNSKQETASLHTKCVQFPSIIGIDEYSLKLRRTSKAEGKVVIKKGKRFINIDIEI